MDAVVRMVVPVVHKPRRWYRQSGASTTARRLRRSAAKRSSKAARAWTTRALVRYADAVTKTTTSIESELRNLRALPAPISSWYVEAGPDATEEPAVWVWVTLAHDDVDASTRARVRDLVRTSVSNMVGNEAHWVYVRFRAASESEQTS